MINPHISTLRHVCNRTVRTIVRTQVKQRGVVLFIALIVLVAMTLAGLALVRSVDTGNMVAGNLALQQSAAPSGDAGVEVARQWVLARVSGSELDQDTDANKAAGYRATWQAGIDLLQGVNWEGCHAIDKACAATLNAGTPDSAGNIVSYVIHRMCTQPLGMNNPANNCSTATVEGSGSTQSDVDDSRHGLGNPNAVYYRITVRIKGQKDSVTFIQSLILV
jgi:type IV pilus assembly protein PilX